MDFDHFAGLNEHWLVTGVGLLADLFEDDYDIVDRHDLTVLVDYWLAGF